MKNEKGVYITPAFPKLIYVLDEDNIREGSKYWELTEWASAGVIRVNVAQRNDNSKTAGVLFCWSETKAIIKTSV